MNMDTELIRQLAIDVNNVVMATAKPYQERINSLQSLINERQAKIMRLESALRYARFFIDGYGAARVKENLGRGGIDAVLKEIDKIIGK